jgi:histidinol-phosphate aminotransferase
MTATYPTREGRRAYVRMDFNEGPPPPPGLLAFEASALNVYPEYGPLRAAAAEAWGLAPDRVVPVNGADEGILLAARLLGQGGLAMPAPSFPMYRIYADQLGLPVAEAPLDPAFDLDVDALLEAPGSLAVLVSPNNPTGKAVPCEAVERVLAQGRPVIVDETYAAFCGQDFAPLLDRWPNLILLRTLSKAYGVPGIRCGFLLASREMASRLEELRSPFNVNGMAAAVGARLLAFDAGVKGRAARAVQARRDLQGALDRAGYRTWPSDTHFFMADLGPGAVARLEAARILVKDLGALRPGLVRISVASPTEARILQDAFLKGKP